MIVLFRETHRGTYRWRVKGCINNTALRGVGGLGSGSNGEASVQDFEGAACLWGSRSPQHEASRVWSASRQFLLGPGVTWPQPRQDAVRSFPATGAHSPFFSIGPGLAVPAHLAPCALVHCGSPRWCPALVKENVRLTFLKLFVFEVPLRV